jgi:hypothetical protein
MFSESFSIRMILVTLCSDQFMIVKSVGERKLVIGHGNEIRYSYEFISYISYYVNSYKARLAKGQTLE